MKIEPTNWWKTKIVMLLARVTPKCHDITRLISESMEHELPLRTRISMRFHYLICVWCERYRDQLGFLREALHQCPERGADKMRHGLSIPARERIKDALRKSSSS